MSNPTNQTSTNPIFYSFQTKFKRQSVNSVLANFLKDKDGDLTEKEKVWWAISAFWLPVAMQESQDYTREEITRYGLSAILRLQHQIAYLALVLNLEVPRISSLPACSINLPTNGLTSEGESDYSQNQQEDEQEQDKFTQLPIPFLSNSNHSNNSSSNDFDSIFGYQ